MAVEVFGCRDSHRCLFSLSHAAVTEQRFCFALCVQVFEFQGVSPQQRLQLPGMWGCNSSLFSR